MRLRWCAAAISLHGQHIDSEHIDSAGAHRVVIGTHPHLEASVGVYGADQKLRINAGTWPTGKATLSAKDRAAKSAWEQTVE